MTPLDFPDGEIVWSASGDGAVGFPDGNTGRAVRVCGVSAGELELQISIGDSKSAKPLFPLKVVENTTTKITAWIITKENDLKRTPEDVMNMMNGRTSADAETFDISGGYVFGLCHDYQQGNEIYVTDDVAVGILGISATTRSPCSE